MKRLISIMIAACMGAFMLASPANAATPNPKWGTLMSEDQHASQEANAGVGRAMVELSWADIEPQKGQWNTSALQSYKQSVLAHKNAGQKVTLGLGTHYNPRWTETKLRSSIGVDNHGNNCHMLNSVFSYDVRQAIRKYISKVVNYIGKDNIDRIRVTSGGNGELMFSDESYCSYGHIGITKLRNSQPSAGKPGTNSTTAQHKNWAMWYTGALADSADFQMNQIRASNHLQWKGPIELIMPGSGVKPSAFNYAAQQHLPDGLLGLGVAWDKVASQINHRWHVNLHQSGTGDGTDNDRGCQSGDSSKSVNDPAADNWSSSRWIAYLAGHYGYGGASGENPGYGDSVPESWYENPNGLVVAATNLAKTCDYRAFYWAHDGRLWDGTLPFSAYTNAIN